MAASWSVWGLYFGKTTPTNDIATAILPCVMKINKCPLPHWAESNGKVPVGTFTNSYLCATATYFIKRNISPIVIPASTDANYVITPSLTMWSPF